MLEGASPIVQGLLGTLLTWFLTALGAAAVFVLPSTLTRRREQQLLDVGFGAAAGVMLAASFWSLLAPAIKLASDWYGVFAFAPVAAGFLLGCGFVHLADAVLGDAHAAPEPRAAAAGAGALAFATAASRRRTLLLLIAIVAHNCPEGLAVGVGFGAVGTSPSSTFGRAVALAWAVGLQNVPEGAAVSLPLYRSGMSKRRAFFYGQLSGAVEPLFGVAGAWACAYAELLLPYALAFAAGAMVFVVVDDLIVEASAAGNGRLASWGTAVGFVLMMALDVSLG